MKRLLGALVALVFTSAAHAQPLVPTFDIDVPSPLVVLETGFYDLEVNYAFTQEDLVNAEVEVDLPPGILVISVSDNQPFTTHCTYQAPLPQGANMDWRCVMSSPLIDVGSGLSSRIVIRIAPVIAFFSDQAPLTFTARLTADNLTNPIEATTQATISTTPLALIEYPRLYDIGTVESLLDSSIGIATDVQRSPYNQSTAFLGQGVEARTILAPGRNNYFLTDLYSYFWPTGLSAWDPITEIVSTLAGLLGPVAVSALADSGGHRAVQQRYGSSARSFIWSACYDVIEANELSPEIWAPVSATDSTLEQKQLGQSSTFTEGAPSIFENFDCDEPIAQATSSQTVTWAAATDLAPRSACRWAPSRSTTSLSWSSSTPASTTPRLKPTPTPDARLSTSMDAPSHRGTWTCSASSMTGTPAARSSTTTTIRTSTSWSHPQARPTSSPTKTSTTSTSPSAARSTATSSSAPGPSCPAR